MIITLLSIQNICKKLPIISLVIRTALIISPLIRLGGQLPNKASSSTTYKLIKQTELYTVSII